MIMSSITEYVFNFKQSGDVIRISSAKWKRNHDGDEVIDEYANQRIYIAYAYILLEDRKPDYCPRIDGAIYYFDSKGKVILDRFHYVDILQDLAEERGGMIDLQHRKKKKEVAEKFQWTLKARQIQQVIDEIW